MNSTTITRSLLLAAFVFYAEGLQADSVDTYVERQLKAQNVPGLSLAVVRNGKVEKAKGYGLADVELNVPATDKTVYQWASVSKQFTATAIMLLAQDGKLNLEDPIRRHYTDSPSSWKDVTIRHLLTHTSGIKSYTSLPNFFKSIRKDYEPDELIGLVKDLPLDFEPGEKWDYCNTGYYLLGLVIEKVSGKSYAQFLKERIFDPLKMSTARLNHQFEIIANRATGYDNRSNGLWRSEFVSPTQPFAAGALVGTVLDLAKWDAALYGDSLLPTSALSEMWTPVKLSDGKTAPYGYGWQIGDIRGHHFVGHGGGIHGFSTYILRLPDDRLTVIVLMNAGGNPELVARGIAGQSVEGLTLATIKPGKDPHPELTERLKTCLIEMADKKDSEMLTPELRENFSHSRRRHAALKEDMSGLKSFRFITSDKPSDREREIRGARIEQLASYKITAGDRTRFYTFALTTDGKVAQLEMEE